MRQYYRCSRLDPCRGLAWALLLGLVYTLGTPRAILADDKPDAKPRTVAGRTGILGLLLNREPGSSDWRVIPPNADVYTNDTIVAVPYGVINAKGGKVRLALLSDLARTSPYPVFESAVILHESDADLDFTLSRGRVDVTNLPRGGDNVKVKVRFQKQVWEIQLGAGAKIAFELYGRWPAGVPFSKTPKPDVAPTLDLVMLVTKGTAHLKADGKTFALSAPPGAAYFHWDSVPPTDDSPKFLQDLPGWVSLALVPKNQDIIAIVKSFMGRLRSRDAGGAGSPGEALAAFLEDPSPGIRRMGVYGLGALDDLPQLIDLLSKNKHPDVREVAIIALRHWIGRCAGQDQKLYEALLKKGFSEKHATGVMQLLHSLSDLQKASPTTYETLIELLQHENPAIRELAGWHLYRLAPTGKDIKYDALSSAEDRQKAQDEWKQLIPPGKLPPKG